LFFRERVANRVSAARWSEGWKEAELPRQGDALRWSGFETRSHNQYRKGDIDGKEEQESERNEKHKREERR
jgi:hypothetical protein